MMSKILLEELSAKKSGIEEKLDRKIDSHEIHLASVRGGHIPGTHVVMFDSPAELFRIIDYYLEHEDERKRIAEKGYNLTVQKYSYNRSLGKMIEIAKKEFGGA